MIIVIMDFTFSSHNCFYQLLLGYLNYIYPNTPSFTYSFDLFSMIFSFTIDTEDGGFHKVPTSDMRPSTPIPEDIPPLREYPREVVTKPRVETIRDTYTADGQNTCLAVVVHGPPDKVEWLKDGKPLKENKKYKTQFNQQTGLHELIIRDSEPADSGEYRCVATNSKGQDSCPIKLDIEPLSGPPKFLRGLHDAKVLSGTSVKFIVEVVGSPTPEVTWYKDGSPVVESEKYSIDSKGITYCLTVRDCKVRL